MRQCDTSASVRSGHPEKEKGEEESKDRDERDFEKTRMMGRAINGRDEMK